jgi:hypothetical protein
MRNVSTSETPLFGLFGHFRDEIKNLIKEQIALARAEVSEKLSLFGRNGGRLAAGGIAAFAGLIILLAALSSLLSFAFESAGVQRSLAFFIGALIIGALSALIGFGFVAKALKMFSKESLSPEKTLHTLKKIKVTGAEEEAEKSYRPPRPKRSSDEIEASVETTRKEVGDTAEEITHRLTPRHMGHVMKLKFQEHPVRTGLLGATTGLLSFLAIRWRIRHAA